MALPERDSEPSIASRSTLGYFFREALRRIWLSKRTSFAAVSMIAIALFILGSFLLLATNLDAAIGRWQERSKLTVYLVPQAAPETLAALEAELDLYPPFRRRETVSREEALVRFQQAFGELSGVVDELDENPFPPRSRSRSPRARSNRSSSTAASTASGRRRRSTTSSSTGSGSRGCAGWSMRCAWSDGSWEASSRSPRRSRSRTSSG